MTRVEYLTQNVEKFTFEAVNDDILDNLWPKPWQMSLLTYKNRNSDH